MSLTADGLKISCDGEDCLAMADVPVPLHVFLNAGQPDEQPVNGWLFAATGKGRKHYCPLCLALYLETLREPAARWGK